MTTLTLKEMEVGKTVYQKGCFTQLKQIAGASLREIEIRLGYRHNRLEAGAYILQANEIPTESQFDIAGYTHRPMSEFQDDQFKYDPKKAEAIFGKLEHSALKRNLVIPSWRLSGPNSLVKVYPVIPHTDSETYPPSANRVSQWLINSPIRCTVVAFVEPGGKFTINGGNS